MYLPAKSIAARFLALLQSALETLLCPEPVPRGAPCMDLDRLWSERMKDHTMRYEFNADPGLPFIMWNGIKTNLVKFWIKSSV